MRHEESNLPQIGTHAQFVLEQNDVRISMFIRCAVTLCVIYLYKA